MPQLKAYCQGKYPAVLVLYDNARLLGDLETYDIRTGMYGLEVVVIAVPKDVRNRPFPLAHQFGKKQRLSRSHNTTLSALAIIHLGPSGKITLDFYHNDYAANPFSPDWLRIPSVRHFRLEKEIASGSFREWAEV